MAHEINIIVTVSFEDNKDGVEKKGKEKNREAPVYGSHTSGLILCSTFYRLFHLISTTAKKYIIIPYS